VQRPRQNRAVELVMAFNNCYASHVLKSAKFCDIQEQSATDLSDVEVEIGRIRSRAF